ncbi:hypothetical protein [Micromonospora craterilacus]|uniref:hypothetical protein n=1 Tax=Micromonospora craterilacus TaxID=1655439 RepID=UPI0018F3217C|nr:hypothetical protein [Micromonospora craterilacus]
MVAVKDGNHATVIEIPVLMSARMIALDPGLSGYFCAWMPLDPASSATWAQDTGTMP